MQQYLSLNVLSLEEGKASKNYHIKITNQTTKFTTEIQRDFKHGFQYVYQLWPCRGGDKHKITINVSTLINGKHTKIGVASPVIAHTVEGEKYKFYESDDSQNLIVFNFKVIKLNIPADAQQTERLKNMNQKMERYLKHCKAELRGYKEFLEHTNNVIKQLNREEDMFHQSMKGLSHKKTLKEESQQFRFGQSHSQYDQDNFEQKIDKSFYEEQMRHSSNKETKRSTKQVKPSKISEPVSHDTPKKKIKTKEQMKSQTSQKQIPKQTQQPSIKNESKFPQVTNNKNNKKQNQPKQAQSRAQINKQPKTEQKQSKIQVEKQSQSEQKQEDQDLSNLQSKNITKSKDFMNQFKQKRSILSKFSYLEKSLTNKPKIKMKQQLKQQSEESDNQVQQQQVQKKKQKKKNEGGLTNKIYQKLKNSIDTLNQNTKRSIESKNETHHIKSEESQNDASVKNMAEEIRKRRDAYTNLVNSKLNQTSQAPQVNKRSYTQQINVIPSTTEGNISKPNTPIANLKISSVTPIESEVTRYKQPISRKVSQFKQPIKKSSPKFRDSGSHQKEDNSIKIERKRQQSKVDNQQDQKQSAYKNSIHSSYKARNSLPQRQQPVTNQNQNELRKFKANKNAETVTNQTQLRNTQMINMQSQQQFKMMRRKKHIRSTTEAYKQSVAGSFFHIQRIDKNSKPLKQSQQNQSSKKQILNMNKMTLKIWSIKITTLTIFEGKAKRCLLQSGQNKFQTSVKQSSENSVEWDDKIVIKHIQPHSSLFISLISNNYKNSVNQGTATISFDELLASGSRSHKAYIYKDNLAIGNLQFKYSLEEQENQRLTFSLPEIKKPEQELPSKSHKISKFDSFEGVDRLIVNDVNNFEGRSNRSVTVQSSSGQSSSYKNRIRTEKERRRHLQ